MDRLISLSRDPSSWLFPDIDPYRTEHLSVGDGHRIYFEQSGNPEGKPVVFIHGGPGAGTDPKQRRFFNPKLYNIILFDQRGAGKSTPHASLENNTTWHLVRDIEMLRVHLGIERWQVFGGSWGSTLALAYAISHPQRVTELVLRGIFLVRRKELAWFYQYGASEIFPDAWEAYREHIPPNERHDFISAYYKRLTSLDVKERLSAARVWSIWEGVTSHLQTNVNDAIAKFGEDHFALAFARIECHYFTHNCFFESENWLLENVGSLSNVPTTIVHGRYDVVCPITSAWDLKRRMPHADFFLIPDAGHSAFEAGISRALVAATDKYSNGQL